METFFGQVVTWLPDQFRGQLLALLALVIADVLLAVALAFKRGNFTFSELPRFYSQMVIPYLFGWAALAVIARLTTPELLGPEMGVIAADGLTWVAWLSVVGAIGASILRNAKDLYGARLPFTSGETRP